MPYLADKAIDAANVKVGVTGAVYVDVSGTAAAPTAATDVLAAEWKSVGYISEDGVTEGNSQDTNEIVAWQNADVVRKTITKTEVTYQFTMIETNTASLGLFYGRDIASGDKKHTIGGASTRRLAVIVDVVDGGQVIRRYIPNAEVSERGDVQFQNGEAVGYQVTLTAYPATAIGGTVEVHYDEAIPDALSDSSTAKKSAPAGP